MTKVILICCSIIPLCLQIPYLVSAWRASRLDQWDWIFFIAAIPPSPDPGRDIHVPSPFPFYGCCCGGH